MAKSTKLAGIYPVQTLRERCTALEAAIALVLVKPRQKPVHQLRIGTRKVEAQLELLSQLALSEPALRAVRESSKRIRKLLAEVRKAAGKVRDLDVQRELIRGAAEEDVKKRIRRDAKQLRRSLKVERAEAADRLLAELRGHAWKLGPKLEKMLESMEPAVALKVPPSLVTKLVRQWYVARTAGEDGSQAKLHDVRKAAKLARYMVECGVDTALAGEYENVQNIGGGWHDALKLRRTAYDNLGKHAELVQIFAAQQEAMLLQFRMTLGLGRQG